MSEQNDKDLEMIQKSAQLLSEHFDSVQIFCTRYESDEIGTTSIKWGIGNWFSRFGQVKEWLSSQDEGTRVEVRKDNEK